jgi:hypothetical protein
MTQSEIMITCLKYSDLPLTRLFGTKYYETGFGRKKIKQRKTLKNNI